MDTSFGFDFSGIEEETQRGPLPVGEYTVVVDKAEMKKTKSGTGYYVNMILKVCDMKKRNGAVVFDIINVKNDSKEAEEIGKGRLKRMLTLAGVSDVQMSKSGPDTLIGKKYNVYLTVKKSEQYGDQNKVASYSSVATVDPTPSANGSDNKAGWC